VRTPIGSPSKTIERDNTVASAVGGTIRVDGMSVVGNVRWKPACRVKSTQPFEERQVTTVRPDVGANVAWIVTGGLLLGGMGYALKARETASTEPTDCTTDDQGHTDCTSEREKLEILATLAGVTGGVAVAWGIGGLFEPTKTEQGNPHRVSNEHVDPTNIPCGKTEDLAGLQLVLRAPGLERITATADAQGNFRFELPDLSEYDASARASVFIGEVPQALAKFVAPETLATEISLAPYATTLAERRAAQDAATRAARAEADQHEFAGAIHGDLAARNAFTFECTPSGDDVCYDAIDNNCDRLYDIGCGYKSGALQWTLAWPSPDDLDLHVIGPDKVHVFFGHRRGGDARLELDVDCLGMFGNNCLAQNVENIYSPPTIKPMEGTYRGWVEVFREATTEDEEGSRVIQAMLGGRIAGKTFRMPISLPASKGARVFFAFAIGPDRDKDSVIDSQDACPDVAGPYSDFAGENGCPDQDGDGIADNVDECPKVAGIREATKRNKRGCPRSYGSVHVTDCAIEIPPIHFATNSFAIPPSDHAILRDAADALRDMPEKSQHVLIVGHTDDRGTLQNNMTLSARRAKSVRDYLVQNEHIASERLATRGAGPLEPREPNDTESGRAKNRRVVFQIVGAQNCGSGSW